MPKILTQTVRVIKLLDGADCRNTAEKLNLVSRLHEVTNVTDRRQQAEGIATT